MPTQKLKHPLYILLEKIEDQFKFNISPTLLSILKVEGELMLEIDGDIYKLSKYLDKSQEREYDTRKND